MKVKQLQLKNYGRFEDLTIDFAPTAGKKGNVTVIVGNNGAGKSQILEAIATCYSHITGRLSHSKEDIFKGEVIKTSRIHNNCQNCEIIIKTEFDKEVYGLTISAGCHDSIAHNGWSTSEKKLGLKILADYQNNKTINLPIIALYNVDRKVTISEIQSGVSFLSNQLSAYEKNTLSNTNFDVFFQWFRDLEDLENEVNNKRRYSFSDNLEGEIYSLEYKKDQLEDIIPDIYDPVEKEGLFNSLFEVIKELDRLKSEANSRDHREFVLTAVSNQNKHLALNFVRQAIEKFTGFKNPRISRQEIPTMIVDKDGIELAINQLSQGEKSLLALVGDIARRLAILNPSLDNSLEGEGVVMIDEVDLHLHPKWQHDLIDKLVTTFPNVQFILTTHSPHIISDRSDILVYSLDDGELNQVPNIYGEDVNSVLTKVFDVDVRDSKVQKELDEIYKKITEKNFDEAEARLVSLEQELPTNNLELMRCRLHLTQAKLASKEASE